MNRKKKLLDKSTSTKTDTSNNKIIKNVLHMYRDHLTSFCDGLLVKETLRRKKLGISFSINEANDFLKEIHRAIIEKFDESASKYREKKQLALPNSYLLDKQNDKEFDYPLIDKAVKDKKHATINIMKKTSIDDSISEWLQTLQLNTRKGYERGIRSLIENDFIRTSEIKYLPDTPHVSQTLYQFSNVPHDLIVEKILEHPTWAPSIKTRNATSYKNFIKFLEIKTEGIISFLHKKPMFPKNRSLPFVKRLSHEQIKQILSFLKEENPRDYCFVSLYLNSQLKLCEALQLTKNNINLQKKSITYISKDKRLSKTLKSKSLVCDMQLLLPHLQNLGDKDLIFRTRNKKPIDPMQITRTLQKAFKKANIPPLSLTDLKKNYLAIIK